MVFQTGIVAAPEAPTHPAMSTAPAKPSSSRRTGIVIAPVFRASALDRAVQVFADARAVGRSHLDERADVLLQLRVDRLAVAELLEAVEPVVAAHAGGPDA